MAVARAQGGKVIGSISGGVLRLRRTRERHWLRLIGGWAIDERTLQDAQAAGAAQVEIVEPDGTTWRIDITTLLSEGQRLDLGHGVQRALPAERWRVERPGIRQLALL